ncbi:hypothetical protein Bca101_059778 [Brassica carinata]
MQPKWIVSLVGCEVICVELTEEVVGDSENRAQRGFDNGEDVDEIAHDGTQTGVSPQLKMQTYQTALSADKGLALACQRRLTLIETAAATICRGDQSRSAGQSNLSRSSYPVKSELQNRGFIVVSERVLEEICTPDELEKIRTASYDFAQILPPPPIVVSDDDDSSEDSSSPPPSAVQCMPSIGVIRLQDEGPPEWQPPDNAHVLGNNPTGQEARLSGEGGSTQDGNDLRDQHEPILTQMGFVNGYLASKLELAVNFENNG